ncbi:hypothetical protein [Pseudomonas sp. KNUC1026]|uniref:hypothetical protein n=1 Tax=Pseudomonas sp. KNUC1026 TaxID=2893890 RepID=UPI001F38BD32|nr:hypothetical protein [Pseudomonas sp. KNUC1026]UFH48029.1 hypothetical protein LN139_12370 [Pseudomonas sp. KNUC1026]
MVLRSFTLLALLAGSANAGPAPWYKYRAMEGGQVVCVQIDPGPQFQRFAGPYQNAGCRP